MTEGQAAVNRVVIAMGDIRLYGLFFDNTDFHTRLTQEVFEQTYSQLSGEAANQAGPEKAAKGQEDDEFADIDPVLLRERLAEHGIANGELVDPEKLEQSPFIQMVEADVERIAAEESAEEAARDEAETITAGEYAAEAAEKAPLDESGTTTAVFSGDTLAPEDRFHVVDVDWYIQTDKKSRKQPVVNRNTGDL